jgi:hypothetical protein
MEETVWYTSSIFWGTQDAARHVIVKTTHRFGTATHQLLSIVAIAWCHVITWHESDWYYRTQKCHISKPQIQLSVYQTLSSFGCGSGDETKGEGEREGY